MAIVAAIDGSPASRRVLERAVDLARTAESELHVIHVFLPPTAVYWVEGAYFPEEESFVEAERRAVWEETAAYLDGAGVEWVRVDRRGYPPTEIAAYAAGVGAEVIVVGTRGRGGLSSLVLGSTSHGVIHEATCDVLVVKTPTPEG